MKFSIVAACILFCLNSCNKEKRESDLKKILSLKNDSITIFTARIDTLVKQNESFREDRNYWFSVTETDKLEKQGLSDPLQDIKDNLHNNPELIPYPGVLGGTMHFGNITLLRDRWVIAEFDDGHIMGAMLLKYSITKDTAFEWVTLDKYID